MSLCSPLSRPDMYGLGIRLSLYTQWFAALAFEHMGQESLPEIRLLGLLLSAGVTVGLMAQLARGALDAAGIYILLLLGSGSHLFLVPVYAWRALSCCNPYWSPPAWSQEEQLRVFRVLNFVLILTASSVGVWFFATYLPGLDRGCRQFGFLFSQASLDYNEPFVAVNAALYVVIVVGCVAVVLMKACFVPADARRMRRRRVPYVPCPCLCSILISVSFLTRQPSKEHMDGLRTLQSLSNLTVFAVLVAAVELSVRWNELPGANDIDTSAQLMPLLVTAGIVVRVVYLHYVEDGDEESGCALRQPTRPRPRSSDEGITCVSFILLFLDLILHHLTPRISPSQHPPTPPRVEASAAAMSSKEPSSKPKDKPKDKSKVHKLSLKGSSKLVADFVFSADDQVKAYIKKIMSQLDKWIVGGKISKLVIVITDKDTGEHVERWQFDVQISQPPPKSKSKPPSSEPTDQENATPSAPSASAAAADKTEAEIQAEIAAIFRQITASVTFLPQLSGDCTFNVLVYADADSDVPVEWGDSDAKEIAGGEHVQLRGFSTASHRVDTLVSYRLGD
ncbi:Uncharacterized protein TCAP_02095 [Tolypocladium capitatum]|uniref:HORMA domain-containing protein n=1 Tax=Tolypocladium capitatum TaxID=45235 RepID=A0A2K3QKD2_9HYPO|nr:Uncharacterized protein TCAP_02095 [Tolypocladium capitatum]